MASYLDNDGDDDGICRTCGEEYDGYGDGWDGECPDCADRTYRRENPDEEFDCGICGAKITRDESPNGTTCQDCHSS